MANKPDGPGRFDTDTRWTSLLQKKLGADHRVIEEGLCGRTTVFQDDLREGRRGLDLIGVSMEMHTPIDLLIVMLGTNDCKTRYNASAGTIAKGLAQVIQKARKNASQPFDLLVISPIHLGEGVGDPGFDPEFDEKSVIFHKRYVNLLWWQYGNTIRGYDNILSDWNRQERQPGNTNQESCHYVVVLIKDAC